MANPAEVIRVGTDSSGRPIYMTRYMADWWEGVVDDLGFRPVITQGAWMERVPGGGAENSEGFHDRAGCLDCRTWDRTPAERTRMVRVVRLHGAGGYRRYASQGMVEDHFHLVLGTDHGLTPAAAQQWREYVAGGDGLEGNGPDYEWRPKPLVLIPPEADMAYLDWPKADRDALVKAVSDAVLDGLSGARLDLKDGGAKRELGAVQGDIIAKLKGLA